MIKSREIPWNISKWHQTIIYKKPAKVMERFLNVLLSKKPKRVKNDTLKRLDKWLKSVPDEPKVNNHALCMAAENNNIIKQAVYEVSNTH